MTCTGDQMTYLEACEYVDQATQAESEQRAEYGMGCVSLGYDPGEWGAAYEGYRTANDPEFRVAKAIIARDDPGWGRAQSLALGGPLTTTTEEIPF